ncbi:MAG: hypothetical protein PHY99_06180, partial [Bacteroidales bacterium]|nr:hypothetical protein [Bacteroidales bacterium]
LMGRGIGLVSKKAMKKFRMETLWPEEKPDDPTTSSSWIINYAYQSEGRILLHNNCLVLIAQKGSSHQIPVSTIVSVEVYKSLWLKPVGINLNLASGDSFKIKLSFPFFWAREVKQNQSLIAAGVNS